MILIYTFYVWNNKTFKFLKNFESEYIKKIYIYGVPSIQKLLTHIEDNHYDCIIGLGDFRKNAKNIRVESKFVNKFFSKKISLYGDQYLEATADIPELKGLHVADKPTHGPCNRSAYLIAQHIKEMGLETKIGYLHVPSGMEVNKINEIASEVIKNLN